MFPSVKLLIEVHDNDNYESIKKLLFSYGFKTEIEKNNTEGNKHLIIKKENRYV